MFALIEAKLTDPQFLAMLLVGIATAASVWTVAMPFVNTNPLQKRMKAVASERERIRLRERERLAKTQQKPSLRQQPKAYMRRVVERFNVGEWLGTTTAKSKLLMAGYRGQHAEVARLEVEARRDLRRSRGVDADPVVGTADLECVGPALDGIGRRERRIDQPRSDDRANRTKPVSPSSTRTIA